MKLSKVAICFSGELRTFSVAMPFILNDFFENIHADIFLHTWTTTGDHKHTDLELEQLKELVNNTNHNLVKLKVDNPINHSGPFGSMLYSIQQANWMKRQHEIQEHFDYDLVIKSRYDMLVRPGTKFRTDDISERTLYYSLGNRGLVHTDVGKHGISDIIFWGDSPTMDIACDTYRYYNWHCFPRYLELMNGNMQDPSDSMLSPGTLIYQRTQKRNVQVKQIDPQYSETLWRTKVKHLNPNSDFEEIRRAY